MKTSYLVALLALVGCSKEEPTVTIPLAWCRDQPTGEWTHQHRSGYTTYTHIGHNTIPHYHSARDWDEQRYVRTCAYTFWNREAK